MGLFTKVAYYQHEMYPFFPDSFNKHRLSTISDQICAPPPISLASPISWTLGLLVTESSGYNWTGIFMAVAAVTHLSVTPTFSVSPSECWALVPLLLWHLQWQPHRSGTQAWPNQICTDSSSSYPTVTQKNLDQWEKRDRIYISFPSFLQFRGTVIVFSLSGTSFMTEQLAVCLANLQRDW